MSNFETPPFKNPSKVYFLPFDIVYQLQSTHCLTSPGTVEAPFILLFLSAEEALYSQENKKKSQYIKWFNKDHPFKSEEVVI